MGCSRLYTYFFCCLKNGGRRAIGGLSGRQPTSALGPGRSDPARDLLPRRFADGLLNRVDIDSIMVLLFGNSFRVGFILIGKSY